MDLIFSTSSRAAIITAVDGERRAVASIPNILEAPESPVASQAAAVRVAVAEYAERGAMAIATFNQTVVIERLRELAAQILNPPIAAITRGGEAEERARAAAWMRILDVPTADAGTAAMRQLDVTAFTAMANADRARWIEQGSVEQLEAIMAAGQRRFPDLPDEIFSRLEDRYAVLNFIRTAGTAADYTRKPSLNDPIATGIDMDAAENAASEALARHNQRGEIIDAVEQLVQGITNIVALTCAMDVQSAFDLVTNGKVPA